MAAPVVGRFAPSPSGRMHLGNAFSCLLAWLSARSAGGEIVLRQEDLDPSRCRRAYALRLLLASWGMTLLTTLLQAVLPNRDIVLMNNAFSTLFLAVLYMQVWDWLAAGGGPTGTAP